jgi:hypothetical protein
MVGIEAVAGFNVQQLLLAGVVARGRRISNAPSCFADVQQLFSCTVAGVEWGGDHHCLLLPL